MEVEFDMGPTPQSKLSWFFQSLGLFYSLSLPAVGLLAFVLTVIIVIRGKGPLAGAGLWFVVTMPLWLGVLGFFDGMIASMMVISMSTAAPKPSELAQGVSAALVTPLVGLWLMAPSFLVATLGSLLRSLTAKDG